MNANDVIQTFMDHLEKSNYDKGSDFLVKISQTVFDNSGTVTQTPVFQKRQLLSSECELPKLLIDTLCDFALAEDNYSEMQFEPEKPKTVERKDNENYLDYVYKTLLSNFEKIQFEITNNNVKNLIISLMQYIPVKLKVLELYVKLKEVGSLEDFINYGELQVIVANIDAKFNTPSPIDGILKILHCELNCMKHFVDSHLYLGRSLYIDSLLSMKKGTDIMTLWESYYEHRETSVDSMFMRKNTLPAMILWFKKFKLLTLAKFTLYFYELLLDQSSFAEINSVCIENNIHIFNKINQIQFQSGAQSLMLVYETATDFNQKNNGVWGSITNGTASLNKYKILLSFPKFNISRDVLGILMSENKRGIFEMNKIDLTILGTAAYIIMKVDSKITLIMCYASKPKNEKKLKSNIAEFVLKLRCHKLFKSVNRYKDHYYHV